MHWRRLHLLLLFVMAGPITLHAAAGAAIDNILLSKTNGITTVQIWPGCQMRYVDHTPFESGLEVRIRITPGADCNELLDELVAQRYAPASLHLANVTEISFEQFSPRDTFIMLYFDEPQTFEVRQTSLGWIEVYVNTLVDPASLPANRAPSLERAETPSATSSLPARPRRTTPTLPPKRRTLMPAPPPVPASVTGDFVVQLGVFDNPDRAMQALQGASVPHLAYQTLLQVNGRTWFGLQLGFFESEEIAERLASSLSAHFPDAWVRYVDPDEAREALASGDLRNVQQQVFAVQAQPGSELTAEDLSAMMASGRNALLEQHYADAIRIYSRVLQAANHPHSAEAREMLGIAFERSGRTGNAIAEYEAFIAEFPNAIGLTRIQNRLWSLESATSKPTAGFSAQPVTLQDTDSWQLHGGVSQYYWRNQEQRVHDGNYLVSTSGILGLGDFTAVRRGERFDLLARFNGSYQHNLVEYDDTGDVGWVSDAFLDVRDKRFGVQGRIGRQTRRQDGVLGRFDGLGLQYQLTPDVQLSVSTGRPIDSPRYIADSDRFFYAASATVQGLMGDRLTGNVFTHQQTVDGISDRQAVGGELHFVGDAVSLFSLLDFDVSYNVLNSALLNAIWYLDNGWSLSGRIDVGAEPFLTTRIALAGQPVGNVEALLENYSEGQVRRLARDRMTKATVFSLGLSAPLGERFDLSVDATLRQADASEASGGVAARPDTGNELFLNATIAATSLFRDNDLLLISLRHDMLRTRDTSRLMFDARIPLFRSLRISPRVSVTHHARIDDTTQLVVSPSLRILYRRGNVLIDLEAGGRWSNRELPPTEFDPFTPDGTEELLGGYVNLGYRWEF